MVDGTGRLGYVADVAIASDRIAEIGDLDVSATREVDGSGLCLAPGLIDVHSHDDIQVLKDPEMMPKLSQGVTTLVVGNCGISASPVMLESAPPDPMNLLGNRLDFAFDSVQKYADALGRARPATNVAALVGHTSLRVTTMDSLDRAANEREIQQMCNFLDKALEEGAIGLSTGLSYANAKHSTTDEVIALAKVVNRHKGVYATHLRDEYDLIIEAMGEAFQIGRDAGVSVVISHFKCAGANNWGRTRETLAYLQRASADQDVACDCYPYTASSSTLDIDQVCDDYETVITWSESHPEEAKQTLHDIAAKWKVSKVEAARRLQPAGAVYYNMHEEDVERVLQYPDCMIGSDGLPKDPHPHPRLWGTFPRVIGHYGRERGLFPVGEAVRKMTGLSAGKFKLRGRGIIAKGMFADLVLFDPDVIIDRATYEQPFTPAEGIRSVWVNGELAYSPESGVSARAGRFLSRSASD